MFDPAMPYCAWSIRLLKLFLKIVNRIEMQTKKVECLQFVFGSIK